MVQLSGRIERTSKRSRREELLEIAARLFAERGFAGVTMDDIGAEAGISGPALYHHFESKDSMLGEMLVSISEHLHRGGAEAMAGHPAAAEALRALVRQQVSFAVGHPELITVQERDLVHAAEADQRRIRRLQASYASMWVDALQRMHPSLERREATAAVLASIGLINSTPHSARINAAAMAELLERMALAALRSAR
jgi:AcrR family transcriptional regulator